MPPCFINRPSSSPPRTPLRADCMYVTSEEGEFIYKKTSMAMAYESDQDNHGNSVQMVPLGDTTVCGFYVVADPYKTVEISFNHLDASCESGSLLGVSGRSFCIVIPIIPINCNSLLHSLSMVGS